MKVSIIVAMAQNRVIGGENRLPWHIPEDFRWFRRHTENRAVVMGRKTFESIGKLLDGRKNIILSRRGGFSVPGATVFPSLEEALRSLRAAGEEEVFIIGGEQVFREAVPSADRIYLTLIHRDYEGDARFPDLSGEGFSTVFEERREGPVPFTFLILERGAAAERPGFRAPSRPQGV